MANEPTGFDPEWLPALSARLEAAENERARVRSALDSANAARGRSLDALQAARQEGVELRRALEAEIARLRESLDEANDDRARLRSAREAWLQERTEFQGTIDATHAALERLRALERSWTWRLTRPLRAAGSRLPRPGRARAKQRAG
jgi:chromosome segregation ATPase